MASYLTATATVTGSAAESAAVRKKTKYAELSNLSYRFRITWTVKQQSHVIFIRSRPAYYNIYVKRQGKKFSFSEISVKLQIFNAISVSDNFRDLLVNDSG